jgi:hypothetical protein
MLDLGLAAALALALSGGSIAWGQAAQGNAGLEFFEKRVRPVLVERCYPCHSHQSERLKAHLYVDSREGLLRGGDTRAALVPGHPEQSLLIEAIGYDHPDLQMPPKGKLAEAQIANLTEWVRIGAPWPTEAAITNTPVKKEFDLEARRQSHWAWKPTRAGPPPPVKNREWCAGPMDQFLLAKLEQHGLRPAPQADRRTLIRRVTLDLIGLPPAAAEVEAFVRDRRPDAYERLVDRLLGSVHFGERWARHWLDLVRYAETLGHEFDYPRHHAWRYRDYVIRAFNADVPYHQFVTEHVAGDLVSPPRRHPVEGFNESIIGTAFYWLGQQAHSPVDVRQHQAEMIDNQVDVLSKAFLGLTVACARCHDHKFDAISTQDFYGLYGMLASSRYAQRAINGPQLTQDQARHLRRAKRALRPLLADRWLTQAHGQSAYALTAAQFCQSQSAATNVTALAGAAGLEARKLERWIALLGEAQRAGPAHVAYLLAAASSTNQDEGRLAELWRANGPAPAAEPVRAEQGLFADFATGCPPHWWRDGDAFEDALAQPGDFVLGDGQRPVVALVRDPGVHSGLLARRLQGALRSPTFTVTNQYSHLLVAGRDSRLNVVLRNYTLIRDPIYGGLGRGLAGGLLRRAQAARDPGRNGMAEPAGGGAAGEPGRVGRTLSTGQRGSDPGLAHETRGADDGLGRPTAVAQRLPGRRPPGRSCGQPHRPGARSAPRVLSERSRHSGADLRPCDGRG